MSPTAIFWPVIAQVALTYAVYLLLAKRRYGVVRAGRVQASAFRNRATEPEESAVVANNISNQFELPVLFYAVCLSLFATAGVNMLTVVLAWLFVLSRVAHAAVHVTTNTIRHRARAFQAGWLILGVMWAWFALHLAGLA